MVSSHEVTDSSDVNRRRLRRIYQRWRRAPSFLRGTSWWMEPPLQVGGQFGVWIGTVASVALIPFSAALLSLGEEAKLPVPEVTLLPFRPGTLLFLVFYGLVHGWLIDRHLVLYDERETSLRPWVRAIRFLVAGIPLFGFYVVPMWRWVTGRMGSEWVSGGSFSSRRLSVVPRGAGRVATDGAARLRARTRRLTDRVTRLVSSQLGLGLLFILDAPVVIWAVFAETTANPTAEQRLVVAILGLGFHLLATVAVGISLYDMARRAELSGFQVSIHLVPALLWLIPVPYLALGGIFVFFVRWLIANRTAQEQTLVHAAHASRATRLDFGGTLREVVARGWRGASFPARLSQPGMTLPAAVTPTYAQDRLLWLYRMKSIALAFDGLFVGWTAAWLGSRLLGWQLGIERGLGWAVNLSFGLCLLGALIMAAYFVALALRTPGPFGVLDEHPYAQFLAVGHLGWLAGLSVGPALYRDDVTLVAEALQAVGVLGGLGFFASFLLRIFIPGGERTQRPFQGMLGLLGFLTVGLTGQSMTQESWFADGAMSWLTAFAWTFWCWHLLIHVAFLRWALRPFDLRHLVGSELPLEVRRGLGFIAITVAVPFGGLAIPGWIYLRHRRWPLWRRLVENEGRDDLPCTSSNSRRKGGG